MFKRLELLILDHWSGDIQFTEILNHLKAIDQLQTDARIASRIVGLISPFVPDVQDNPTGAGSTQPVQLALRFVDELVATGGSGELVDDKYRFPGLEDAANWLGDLGIATADEFANLSFQEKQQVLTAPGVNSRETLFSLKNLLEKSSREKLSLPDFRTELRSFLEVKKHEEETIYRTALKRSYVEGMERTLSQPVISREFGYVKFVSTHDARVRDHHFDLDGFVVQRGTPEYAVIKRVLSEWNCRCSIIPITRSRAFEIGVKTLIDLPSSVRHLVG
jgi:hypothetical protein